MLFENYIEKWKKTTPVATTQLADDGTELADQCSKRSKLRGKYTGKKSGHCKYGGWCHEGTARFNELYNLVCEDRLSAPAATMEHELLQQHCMEKHYGNERNDGGADDAFGDERNDGDANDGEAPNASSASHYDMQLPVEACWDEV